jgi:hypothetical protein
MSMVNNFVRHSDGFVTLESEVGRGTTTSLYLPAAPVIVSEAEDSSAMRAPPPALTPSLRSS